MWYDLYRYAIPQLSSLTFRNWLKNIFKQVHFQILNKFLYTLFLRDRVVEELETKGYSVIPNVLSENECEKYKSIYKAWLDRFEHERPYWARSLMKQYRLSHCKPTWNIRLAAKPVFASIWKTDNFLTSMDGISIGEPPN